MAEEEEELLVDIGRQSTVEADTPSGDVAV